MKTNLTTGLAALCAILLIVSLVNQSKQKSEIESLRQQHDDFVSATTRNQREVKTNMTVIANAVQQQTAVMYRALGKIIPVELPESASNKLAELEARIADEKSWPTNSTDADAMFAELRDLLHQIPPWAEDDLLPRLYALRWGVQSVQVLRANENAANEDLETAAEVFANQLSIQPDGGSTNLAVKLATRQQDVTGQFKTFRQVSAINEATNQFGMTNMTDGLAAWQRLSEWTNSPQAVELRQQLHSRLLDDEIVKFSDAIKAGLEKLGAVTNAALRQAGYFRTMENVTAQRLRLLEETDISASAISALANLSTNVETRIKAEFDKQNLGYQQWVLQQISDFRSAFNTAMQRTKPGAVYGNNPDPDFDGVANAMVSYLIPISPAHLDSAVAVIYRQAFDDGMGKLSGDLKTNVAKKDAVTSKKTPQNYLGE